MFENSEVTREICLIRDAGETIDIDKVEDALYFAEWLRPAGTPPTPASCWTGSPCGGT
nr:hypothetical protein GCM10020093_054210 [Planobispora longispora]